MSHSTRLFEVEVRHIEYGVTIVRAHSEQEAMSIAREQKDELAEGWISIEYEPFAARPKDFQATLDKDLNQLT